MKLTRPHREVAIGNTFGATALSSYGGFWISFAILLTPAFKIPAGYAYKDSVTGELTGHGINDWNNAMGFFLMGWWIFTTVLLLCTLRSTVAFFLLFFTLDIAFLLLAVGHLAATAEGVANLPCQKAGGYFGLFAALLAWYNALAGIADSRYVAGLQYLQPVPKLTYSSATLSLSFLSPISHGPRRDASREPFPSPSARPSKALVLAAEPLGFYLGFYFTIIY